MDPCLPGIRLVLRPALLGLAPLLLPVEQVLRHAPRLVRRRRRHRLRVGRGLGTLAPEIGFLNEVLGNEIKRTIR